MLKTKLTFPLIGLCIGYFILHPVSMLITMNKLSFNAFLMSFSYDHLNMAFYFSLLGLLFGGAVAFLQVKILIQKQEVSDKNALLKQVVIEKESLIRILSHDLKNLICGSKEQLEHLFENPKMFSLSSTLERGSEIVHSLTEANNLIYVSKKLSAIESGKKNMILSEYNIVGLVEESVRQFLPGCNKKKLTIDFCMPDHPLFAKIEPAIFQHTIISNLMSNTIKYSNEEQTIKVKLGQKGDTVEIAISNIGPEITPEKQSAIFSVSAKTSASGALRGNGAGFGLPLVHKYVRLMNGTISVESKLYKVIHNQYINTFRIKLPLEKGMESNGI